MYQVVGTHVGLYVTPGIHTESALGMRRRDYAHSTTVVSCQRDVSLTDYVEVVWCGALAPIDLYVGQWSY